LDFEGEGVHVKLKFSLVTMFGVVAIGALAVSAQAPKTQWVGVYTAEQAARGAAVYKQKCASCHGADLAGYAMESTPAPALTGPDFEKNWDDFPISDLYDKIKMLMPQDDPGSLTEAQVADVIAHMLQAGKYPAGTVELTSDHDQLAAIKFMAKKPA
jgi:cytochrome c5